MIQITRPGIATTFQDAGRPGHAHLGVGRSGAVDAGLAALVNRLVDNEPGCAVIETVGGLEITAERHVWVASTNELAPLLLEPGGSIVVRPAAHDRLWQYLAIHGGFAVQQVLGSRSYDTMAGLGPRPPETGDRIPIGQTAGAYTVVDHAALGELSATARVVAGPRRDWFTAASWRRFVGEPWTVTTTSRVGVRLQGPSIERAVRAELPTEGLIRGAIQVPPSGEPVMMLADHPTTGGYPVIAVVHPDDVATVAQHSTGSSVRFRQHR